MVEFGASGDNDLIPAVDGQILRLFRLLITFDAAVTVRFKDGASTNLSGPLYIAANGSIVLDFPPSKDALPWFTTARGNALVLNLSAAVNVGGTACYTRAAS